MARSLPSQPNLDQLRIQAKEIVKAHRSKDASVCDPLRRLKRFADASDADIFAAKLTLTDAQYALALDYGFPSWDALKKHVDRPDSPMTWMHYSEDARMAIYHAQEGVVAAGRTYVDLVDWFDGIRRDPGGQGAKLLAAMDQAFPIDRDELEVLLEEDASPEIRLGTRIRRAVELAKQEAGGLGHRFIGSQHLALGGLRVLTESSDAARRYQRLDLARDLVRRIPADNAQLTHSLEYHKRLAEVGGDRRVLTYQTYAELVREHRVREVFATASDEGLVLIVHKEDGEPAELALGKQLKRLQAEASYGDRIVIVSKANGAVVKEADHGEDILWRYGDAHHYTFEGQRITCTNKGNYFCEPCGREALRRHGGREGENLMRPIKWGKFFKKHRPYRR